ncbi:MAG: hypothetical protein E6Q94_06040 [Burkholderiaceae bacterium]|nr:MAG: hypothetical protein E6Q94_06040 [Burkholderiaceae bacterium]
MDADAGHWRKLLLQGYFAWQPDVVLIRKEKVAGAVFSVLEKQFHESLTGTNVLQTAPAGVS